MKILMLFLSAICILTIPACSAENAGDLFETAQFEELQNNREHAKQLYERIIKKYPESEFAEKAEGRLEELMRK